MSAVLAVFVAAALAGDDVAAPTPAEDAGPVPPELAQVGVEEHVGARLPVDAEFRDPRGNVVRLGDAIDGRLPVVLVPAYYRCPMLCGLVVKDVAGAIRELGGYGTDFRALTVSFDPGDRPQDAGEARRHALSVLGRDADWPFLVGPPPAVEAFDDAIGWRVRKDPSTGEYAHPTAIVVLTPDGVVSSYLYGPNPAPQALHAALIAASAGSASPSIGSPLATCFRWSSAATAHGGAVAGILRVGWAAVAVGCVAALGRLWRREAS